MHPLMMYAHDPTSCRRPGTLPRRRRHATAPRLAAGVVLQGWPVPAWSLGFGCPRARAALPAAEGAGTGPLAPNAVHPHRHRQPRHRVCKHHEMGQGNTTGLASLVAEELDADWALVRTEYAPSDAKLLQQPRLRADAGHRRLVGDRQLVSADTAAPAPRARHARRRRRRRLEGAGRRDHGVARACSPIASGKRATYGEMAEAASRQPPPDKPALKDARAVHLHRQGPVDAAGRFAVQVQRHGGLHHRRQAARPADRGDRVAAALRRQAGVVRRRRRRSR